MSTAPAVAASRSATLPGTADGCGANESVPGTSRAGAFSTSRSAISSTARIATSTIVPCRNSVGPSIATDPTAATERVPASSTTATNAATRPPSVSTSWLT